jgi:hypothetical protein
MATNKQIKKTAMDNFQAKKKAQNTKIKGANAKATGKATREVNAADKARAAQIKKEKVAQKATNAKATGKATREVNAAGKARAADIKGVKKSRPGPLLSGPSVESEQFKRDHEQNRKDQEQFKRDLEEMERDLERDKKKKPKLVPGQSTKPDDGRYPTLGRPLLTVKTRGKKGNSRNS